MRKFLSPGLFLSVFLTAILLVTACGALVNQGGANAPAISSICVSLQSAAATPGGTSSPSASAANMPSASATVVPSGTVTAVPSSTASPTVTYTPVPSMTATPIPAGTSTPVATTPAPSGTITPSPTGVGVTVTINVQNFQVVNNLGGAISAGQGHVHYFLDTLPPTEQGKPAVPDVGKAVEIPQTSYTWPNVAPGLHFFAVELVNNNHTPLDPPVVSAVLFNVPSATGTASTPSAQSSSVIAVSTVTKLWKAFESVSNTGSGATTTPEGKEGKTTTPASTTTAATTPTANAAAGGDITGVLSTDERLHTLYTAIMAANLNATLQNPGPFTIFAPSEQAFAALPAGTLNSLLNDIPTLTNIITYHVVQGVYTATDLTNITILTSVEGEMLTISMNGSDVMVNDAKIITADVSATNGIIHIINKVLIPPSVAATLGLTPVPSGTATAVPSPSVTASPSPSVTLAPSPSMTVNPSPSTTVVQSPTVTPAPSPSVTAVPSPSVTASPSPTVIFTPSPSATVTSSPSISASPSPSVTPVPSPTITTSPSASPSAAAGANVQIQVNIQNPGTGKLADFFKDALPASINGEMESEDDVTVPAAATTTFVWNSVGSGWHVFGVQILNADLTPVEPEVMSLVLVFVPAGAGMTAAAPTMVAPSPVGNAMAITSICVNIMGTAVASPSPSITAVPSPSITLTPSPSVTAIPSPSITATPSPSPTVTAVPSPSVTITPSPSVTLTPSPSVTVAPSPSATQTPVPTVTASPSPSPTVTALPSPSVSPSPSGPPVNVRVTITVQNFQITSNIGGTPTPGSGHVIFYMDTFPLTTQGLSAIPTAGQAVSIADTTYVWTNVTRGLHSFSVQLVNNNNTPLSPPVVSSVLFDVPSTVMSPSPSVVAAQASTPAITSIKVEAVSGTSTPSIVLTPTGSMNAAPSMTP